MTEATRLAAQRRTDEIRVFRDELARLEAEEVLRLSAEQRRVVDAHHRDLLADFAATFDIDRDTRARQLSLGMRIASFLGALAFAASVFFLFYQFWGRFPENAQVAILVAASLGMFGVTVWLRGRDASGYFTKLAALVAFACFVLNIAMLGQIFNITPSDHALLPWAAFALLLAYACDLRLLLAAGILSVMAYVAARVGTWSGMYWIHFGERPENFMPLAIALFLLPQIVRHARHEDFPPVYRVFGLVSLLLPALVLANWGGISYLPWPVGTIEAFYQLCGFALSAAAVWLGLRRQWPETVNAGLRHAALRLAYPDRDRHIIVRGQITPWRNDAYPGGPRGFIRRLHIAAINVPFAYRDVLGAVERTVVTRQSSNKPAFSAEVAFGRRLEPWIVSVSASE